MIFSFNSVVLVRVVPIQMTRVLPLPLSKATPSGLRNLLFNTNPKTLRNRSFPNPSFNKTLKHSSISSRMSESGGSGGSAGAPITSKSGDANLQLARFPLSPSSLLVIQKGDITKWSVDGASDAIVSFRNSDSFFCLPFLGIWNCSLYVLEFLGFHFYSHLFMHCSVIDNILGNFEFY